ncbi:MAG: DUF2635 domain-containing protein [Alphaproteobacteria bacterium]|nr:DUF2635 domain-containing protein [Alphaproteobacteria bacterium]
MNETLFYLTPKPGIEITDPNTGQIVPAQGQLVPRTDYWLRHIHHGDARIGEPPLAVAAETIKKPARQEGDR